MTPVYKIGDLVHIPQAVKLIDYEDQNEVPFQLTIPLQVHETQKPEVALVIDSSDYGYLRVFWAGKSWSVRNESVYSLNGVADD